MVAQIRNTSAAKTAATPQPVNTTEDAPAVQTMGIELNKVKRYFFGDRLYLEDEVYIFNEDDARYMLRLQLPSGLYVFMKARTRTIHVQVDPNSGAMKPVGADLTKHEVRLSEVFNLVKNGTAVPPRPLSVNPPQRIELGEGDDETSQRLDAIDSASRREVDSSRAVTV